jgi:topoisomerase IV subunit A
MLIFPLSEMPEMARGKGVRLQRYKDGGRTLADLADWTGDRGLAGRLPPMGFPKSNSFGPRGL